MLPRFFIDRPIFGAVLALATILAGELARRTLPVSQYPKVTPPTIQIDCNYPGASAQVHALGTVYVGEPGGHVGAQRGQQGQLGGLQDRHPGPEHARSGGHLHPDPAAAEDQQVVLCTEAFLEGRGVGERPQVAHVDLLGRVEVEPARSGTGGEQEPAE